MKAMLKMLNGLVISIAMLCGFAFADIEVSVGNIDEIDITENRIIVSDVLFELSRFTVVQYEGDTDERRRPLSSLKVGDTVEIVYDYEHFRINKIDKVVILSSQ